MGTPPKYAKGIAKRAEILDVALDVFARDGYGEASLRQIAEGAHISLGGLMHYFSSKEELFTEILRHRDEVDGAEFAAHSDPFEALMAVIARNADKPGLVSLFLTMSGAAQDPDHPAHDFFAQRYGDMTFNLSAEVRRRQDRGEVAPEVDPEEAVRAIIAAADGIQAQWLIDPSIDMEQVVRGVIERFLPLPGQNPADGGAKA